MADLEKRLEKALKAGDKGDLRKARQENERMATALRRVRAMVSDELTLADNGTPGPSAESFREYYVSAVDTLRGILAAVKKGLGS